MDDEKSWADFETFAPICIPFFFNWAWTQLNLNWTRDETLHKFVLHLYMENFLSLCYICAQELHEQRNFF
jgi:hypothetical protein